MSECQARAVMIEIADSCVHIHSGDIVLMHHVAEGKGGSGPGRYEPSMFLRTPQEGTGVGHRDVIRSVWHDVRVSR
jgi:hypothetical protein